MSATSAVSKLDTLITTNPEWTAWLCVVREVAAELSSPSWDANPPRTAVTSDLTPLLAGAVLRPDDRAVARLLDRLSGVARTQGLHALAGDVEHAQEKSSDAALAVFLAAVNGDHLALDLRASRTGASPEGMRTLAQLLPMPYLHACARHWASSPVSNWSQGYCPVCGAWPAFAELRGVERARHLRCGRCGVGWPMPVLACIYCATTDHETLGSLVVDDKKSRFALDVCRGCSGYLKSYTTLQATPADEVLATDLASVEFDLAAIERGFLQPPGPGFALRASLAVAGHVPPSAPRGL
ncbi:MAG: formate dehydrogenase accessory protein FdhE [Burkholderiales bacterium]|nr:formate dehydrogenase accessory protein FdhE [Burkholderiales bacterium]MDP2398792.1 formate dehydrogenase accessory protein FdhE [Burkholderiales bacterium]